MGRKIALGAGAPTSIAEITAPETLIEQVAALQHQLEELTRAFHVVNSVRIKDKRQHELYDGLFSKTNKDGLPIGLSLVGSSQRGGTHVLTISEDGYYIGTRKFESLSSAAEASSGMRRSGWTFWKLPDGKSAKDAYGKEQ